MADLDLKLIKDNLEKERETLVAEFQQENADLPGNDTVNPDPLDLADISVERDISFGRIRHLKRRLRQVENALKRLADGKYGICVKCGRPINPERLEAMPSATMCLSCKKRQESVQ